MSGQSVIALLTVAIGAAACAQGSLRATSAEVPICSIERASDRGRVEDLARRERESRGLYRAMVVAFGEPSMCFGASDRGDDGVWVEYRWASGSSYRGEHLAPEIAVSIASGLNLSGLALAQFLDDIRVQTRRMGLQIDWSKPMQKRAEDGLSVVEYLDPDPGLNGIVRLHTDAGGALQRVQVSVAP